MKEGCGKAFKEERIPCGYLNWKEATYKKTREGQHKRSKGD